MPPIKSFERVVKKTRHVADLVTTLKSSNRTRKRIRNQNTELQYYKEKTERRTGKVKNIKNNIHQRDSIYKARKLVSMNLIDLLSQLDNKNLTDSERKEIISQIESMPGSKGVFNVKFSTDKPDIKEITKMKKDIEDRQKLFDKAQEQKKMELTAKLAGKQTRLDSASEKLKKELDKNKPAVKALEKLATKYSVKQAKYEGSRLRRFFTGKLKKIRTEYLAKISTADTDKDIESIIKSIDEDSRLSDAEKKILKEQINAKNKKLNEFKNRSASIESANLIYNTAKTQQPKETPETRFLKSNEIIDGMKVLLNKGPILKNNELNKVFTDMVSATDPKIRGDKAMEFKELIEGSNIKPSEVAIEILKKAAMSSPATSGIITIVGNLLKYSPSLEQFANNEFMIVLDNIAATSEPAKPVEPVKPAAPAAPVKPDAPEIPAAPEIPDAPAEPAAPAKSAEPDEPVKPAASTEPEKPVQST